MRSVNVNLVDLLLFKLILNKNKCYVYRCYGSRARHTVVNRSTNIFWHCGKSLVVSMALFELFLLN